MKVGDLIKVAAEACAVGSDCGCWFCYNNSNRIGVVVERLNEEGVRHSEGYWAIMFDVGEWRLYGTEAEVISEGR
jgi:hypothetical protein